MTETKRYFDYQHKIFGDFGIKNGQKVLDIGAGQDPFPLATHLSDKFPSDNSHRSGRPMISDSRIFLQADIENMPEIEDKYFDFVYCSHLIEHVNDPVLACKELMRIGKRGYIETPSKTGEIMFGDNSDFHKWYVYAVNHKLVFEKIKKNQPFGDLFYSLYDSAFNDPRWSSYQTLRLRFLWTLKQYPEIRFTMFLWDDNFNIEVIE